MIRIFYTSCITFFLCAFFSLLETFSSSLFLFFFFSAPLHRKKKFIHNFFFFPSFLFGWFFLFYDRDYGLVSEIKGNKVVLYIHKKSTWHTKWWRFEEQYRDIKWNFSLLIGTTQPPTGFIFCLAIFNMNYF